MRVNLSQDQQERCDFLCESLRALVFCRLGELEHLVDDIWIIVEKSLEIGLKNTLIEWINTLNERRNHLTLSEGDDGGFVVEIDLGTVVLDIFQLTKEQALYT